MSHGVNGIAPKLYSDGILVVRRKQVEYSSAHGKLTYSLHHIGSRIACGKKHTRYVAELNILASPYRKRMFF